VPVKKYLVLLLIIVLAGCAPAMAAIPAPQGVLPVQGGTPVETATDAVLEGTLQASSYQVHSTLTPQASPTFTQTIAPSKTPTVMPSSTEPAQDLTMSTNLASWYIHPENDPSKFPYKYARVTHLRAPIYLSLEDAVAQSKTHRTCPGDESYVSYDQVELVGGKSYYKTGDDSWMSQDDLEPIEFSHFSGLIMTQKVEFKFGWVLQDSYSISAVGSYTTTGVNFYARYSVVKILSSQEHDGTWYEISPGEWLPAKVLSVVTPESEAPYDVKRCRWIEVNIAQQNLSLYDNCELVFATLISSGRDEGWTSTGVHPVFNKAEYHTLISQNPFVTGNYYLEDVPYLLFYYGEWAIHGAYWHYHFGEPWSHGCVNLSLPDARWVYEWAQKSDLVYITNQ